MISVIEKEKEKKRSRSKSPFGKLFARKHDDSEGPGIEGNFTERLNIE